MTKGYIRYKSDYKYQLAEGYEIPISIQTSHDITTECIDLNTQGNLVVKKGMHGMAPLGPPKTLLRICELPLFMMRSINS